jgi:hypothetical protein
MELITSTHRHAMPADFPFVQPGIVPAGVADTINQQLAALPKVKRYEGRW